MRLGLFLFLRPMSNVYFIRVTYVLNFDAAERVEKIYAIVMLIYFYRILCWGFIVQLKVFFSEEIGPY